MQQFRQMLLRGLKQWRIFNDFIILCVWVCVPAFQWMLTEFIQIYAVSVLCVYNEVIGVLNSIIMNFCTIHMHLLMCLWIVKRNASHAWVHGTSAIKIGNIFIFLQLVSISPESKKKKAEEALAESNYLFELNIRRWIIWVVQSIRYWIWIFSV